MNKHTLSFYKGDEAKNRLPGWQSFYSYYPEGMIGMQGGFFSFSGGNLHQHWALPDRNTFYGVPGVSKLIGVMSHSPLENHVYKAMGIEGNAPWGVLLTTDIQEHGFIEAGWFIRKENTLYSFIRSFGAENTNSPEYVMRAAVGVGTSTNITVISISETLIEFPIDIGTRVNDLVSVGDYIYHMSPPYSDPLIGGVITEINRNIHNNENFIRIDTSVTGAVGIGSDPFFLALKDATAESFGVLGHYCTFTLINDSTSPVELFAIHADIMKSYP